MKQPTKKHTYSTLITDLASLIEQGRKTAVRYVNTALVATYWLIGRRIVKYEQKGKRRAEYGEELISKLSRDLNKKFGRGFSPDNLEAMRSFYLCYPITISETMSRKLEGQKSATLSRNSEITLAIHPLTERFILSWSHYRLLLRLDELFKREFYESECVRGNWSVRQLDRQIQSMLYERTALSRRKTAVIAKAHEKPITLKPEDEIKDPYILEFLGLKEEYSESQLEEALIRHMEHFLLELGNGFTFVARQKRITLEGRHYRLDLLLYHRVLRCLVAIDLKIGEFTHADAGQMNLYVNYLKDKGKLSDENDPIGIILCSDKKNTVVEYALGGMNNKVFASKYKLKLPDPQMLKREIEHERQRFVEMRIVEERKGVNR
ncbi:MAG: PDDEXK nuclease domain-containing protein [Nitrospirae bacterium]|nr:PDDEXK nuclease domain-containing protein [Nitrospirota bacterium]MCL5978323.1 PDDEXK nuclease domain-containing protein [Nitrospirota bacterium]